MPNDNDAVHRLNQKNKKYEDIIHLPHPISTVHPQMSIHDRAAQFSPFAALTGFDGEIKETARLTNQKIELDEDAKFFLDEKLMEIQERISKTPVTRGSMDQIADQLEYEICYFQTDQRKNGGSYITKRGCVKKIDVYKRQLIMDHEVAISMDDILEIIEMNEGRTDRI